MQSGQLRLTLSYPAAAFLYKATKPRVLVDGAEAAVSGWGTHLLPVAAGRHRVEVFVPYVFPRKAGKARTDVTVTASEDVRLEYMAPSISFARGSLGGGEQTSTGYTTVRTFNAVAVVVALIGLVYVCLGG